MTDNPFGGMFQDIFAMIAQQGPDAWRQTATQLALNIARGEDGDPNPSPLERSALEELAPLVARHVDALFGVATTPTVEASTRSALTLAALDQWQPLLEPLVNTPLAPSESELSANPLMAQMASTLGPLFAGFQIGSVAGHFSERAWSLATLPLPRRHEQRLLVVNNLKHFADAWSLPTNEVYVFALAQEFVAALVLSQPGTGDALRALLLDAVKETASVQRDLLGKLQGLMGSDMSAMMANPEALLEGITTPTSSPAIDAINAAGAALSAFFDAVAFEVTRSMVGPIPALEEAYKRHRLSDARGEDAASALFGISTQGEHHDHAASFVRELSAAHSLKVFDAFLRVDGLPSAVELTTPHDWYARVSSSPLA